MLCLYALECQDVHNRRQLRTDSKKNHFAAYEQTSDFKSLQRVDSLAPNPTLV